MSRISPPSPARAPQPRPSPRSSAARSTCVPCKNTIHNPTFDRDNEVEMADAKIPMTPRGAQRLKDELKRRKEVERLRIVRAIEEARGHGDLSENADYSAAKEAQSFNEGRIKELEVML